MRCSPCCAVLCNTLLTVLCNALLTVLCNALLTVLCCVVQYAAHCAVLCFLGSALWALCSVLCALCFVLFAVHRAVHYLLYVVSIPPLTTLSRPIPLTLYHSTTNTAAWLREATYTSIKLGAYGPIKEMLGDKGSAVPFHIKFLSGSASGAIGSVIGNPFDVMKTMQSE
jgi:hypothetical protein